MNYEELKRNIADVVKPNGNQEITGQIMQDALFALIENLGEGWQFGGAVRPSDVPALGADVRGFWLAVEKGVYADFGGVEVTELSAVVYSDGWAVLPLGVAFGVDTEAEIGALSERVKALEADGSVTTSRIADKAVTTPKIANEAITKEKLGAKAVTISRIANGAVITPKIANGAVTAEKLDPDWRKNLAHKAVVYNFNVNNPKDVPQLVQAYKKDANQSVFLVYRSGMYYPAVLITQQDNEAIIFYQPEGTNLKKVIVRIGGIEEVTIWGDTVRYGKQTLTDAQKLQARVNIDAATKAYIVNYGDDAETTEATIAAFKAETNKSSIYIRLNADALLPATLRDDILDSHTIGSVVSNTAFTVTRYGYNVRTHQWYTQKLEHVVVNGISYNVQNLTDKQKKQVRTNIDAATKAYVLIYDASSDDTEAIIAAFKNDANGTQLYVKADNYLIPAIITDDYIMATNVAPTFKIPCGNVVDVTRYIYSMTNHKWTTLSAENVANYGLSYGAQNLSNAQKAQARKNIDVDFLTEDEVANLWATTN